MPLPSTSLSSFFSYFVETCVTILKFSTNQKLDYLSLLPSLCVRLSILLYEHVRDVRWCIQMKWKLVYDYVFLTRHMGAYNVWHVLSQFQIPHLNHNFMFFCFALGKRRKKHHTCSNYRLNANEWNNRERIYGKSILLKLYSIIAYRIPKIILWKRWIIQCLFGTIYIHKLGFNLKASEMYH